MKKSLLLVFVALALILTACATNRAATQAYGGSMPTSEPPGLRSDESKGQEMPAAAPGAPQDAYYNSTTGSAAQAEAQRRLIQTDVTMSIVVTDPQKKMEEINKMAAELGGYLVSMSMGQVYSSAGNAVPQGSISIRIPAEKLEEALTKIQTGVVDVPTQNRTGIDVTAQYVDLKSQLSNLQQAEEDLIAIMDEAKNNPGNDSTTKTQDVLNVYNQIVNIRGQIEQIQGQMKYIEETTSTSAINVTLIAEETVQPIEIGGWHPKGVANEAIQSLVRFFQGFVDFLIVLVLQILPELLLIFGPIALVIWAIVAGVKRRKARKSKANAA
jgi:hypothetical protein